MSEQLRSNEYGLKTDQLKTLLPDIQVIRNYNTKFLMDLTPRLNSWSANQSVGDVFLQVVRYSLPLSHIPFFLYENLKFVFFLI